MKTPTPLQLFKQWKKYNLASNKTRDEKKLLDKMAYEAKDEMSKQNAAWVCNDCGTQYMANGMKMVSI
jgi:rubrerythrin